MTVLFFLVLSCTSLTFSFFVLFFSASHARSHSFIYFVLVNVYRCVQGGRWCFFGSLRFVYFSAAGSLYKVTGISLRRGQRTAARSLLLRPLLLLLSCYLTFFCFFTARQFLHPALQFSPGTRASRSSFVFLPI